MLNKKFRLSSEIVCSRSDAGLKLLNLNCSEKLLTLTDTSIEMFDLIISGQTYEEIIEILLKEYNIEKNQLEKDVMNLVVSLLFYRIIEII